MKYQLLASTLIFIVVSLTGCSATKMTSTWKDPGAQPIQFQQGDRVVALVIYPNEGVRRPAEDALAKEITGRGAVIGVPAYTIIPTAELQDETKARAHIEEYGAVGVVVMSVVEKSQKVTATPVYGGPRYNSFWGGGYYHHGIEATYSPGFIRTDHIYSIETLVYDLRQGKLVWAGQSDTYNPTKVEATIKEIADEAVAEMAKEGLIQR